MGGREYTDFDSYWRAYLEAHSLPATRAFHFLATGLGFVWLFAAIFFRNPWLVLGAFATGYPMAIASHYLIQKNKPLVGRPIWGAISDLRMCWLALTGGLAAEYQRRGLGNPHAGSSSDPASPGL